jgi:hypothetical protein
VVLHPAESKRDVVLQVIFHPHTHHSTIWDIVWPSILLPGILCPKTAFSFIAHHTVFLGLVWWWASPATWGLSCAKLALLFQSTYPSKWKHPSSLINHPLRYFVSWTIHTIEFGDMYHFHVRNYSTKCIMYGWN